MQAIARGWELDVRRGPGWLFVKVGGGDAADGDCPPLADQIWSLLERHFVYRLALELDELEVLNSALLGELLVLRKRIEEHGGVMRLCGLSPYNQRVVRSHGLVGRFPAYGSVEEAVMERGLRKPR